VSFFFCSGGIKMLGAAKPPLRKFSAASQLRILRRTSAAAQKGRIESGRS